MHTVQRLVEILARREGIRKDADVSEGTVHFRGATEENGENVVVVTACVTAEIRT